MASGTIRVDNVVTDSNVKQMYAAFSTNGLPYLRFIDQNGKYWQYVVNLSDKLIRFQTNETGSWVTPIECIDRHMMFFLPGDTYTAPGYGAYIYGHVTTGGKDLRMSIPLGKMTNLISSVTITTLNIGVRIPSGGYVTGDVYDYKSSIYHIDLEGSFVHVTCRNDDGWGVTNNIPVTGLGDFACTFS